MKVLLIDNYDSFIYNLSYELEALGAEVTVCRNDIDYLDLINMVKESDVLVLSPGPGFPKDAGHTIRLIKEFHTCKPILGICLGHQAIVEAFGGVVSHAKIIVHGKTSSVENCGNGIFSGLSKSLSVARYHSLAAIELPESLKLIARTNDKEVMSVAHNHFPTYGIQFHPESIMSTSGTKIIGNFLSLADNFIAQEKIEGGVINA